MKPNRMHESASADILGLLQKGERKSRSYVIAVVGAAIAHAILDLAQAVREGHDSA
jgi:hypothetical protein